MNNFHTEAQEMEICDQIGIDLNQAVKMESVVTPQNCQQQSDARYIKNLDLMQE